MINPKPLKATLVSSMMREFNSFPVDRFVPHKVCPTSMFQERLLQSEFIK